MVSEKSELFKVLTEENVVLDEVIQNQVELRKSVNEKDWTSLMTVISKINILMDKFNRLDEKRDQISASLENLDAECNNLLTVVRGKLVKCRTENKALSDYITITRNFVQKIINTALPQSTNKVYTRTGVVQRQPSSVVVDTLF